MPCVHLRELYEVCRQHDLKLTSSDLVRIVCKQCGVVDTCPSIHCDQVSADSAAPGTSHPPGAARDPVSEGT